ncbi:MAG: FAD-binding oxidoreductase, partial [Alphaproteobacteria bacterium]|nr:FAD-binding oxidoreductase [Alphaproteobacteria bacterium]
MTARRLKHFGWGREGEGMTPEEEAFALGTYQRLFGTDVFETVAVPPLDALTLRAPRLAPPAALAGICSTPPYHRAA